ncbi:MAG: cyclopropane-fatty-acyl-phospholipid synthase family protein [bacterium]
MIGKVLDLVPAEKKGTLLAGIVWRLLGKLKEGHLVVHYQGETRHFGQPATETDLHATVTIHSHAGLLRTVSGGSIGAGEAYMKGDWSSPNLTSVMRIFIRNIDVLDSMENGLARLSAPIFRMLHWLNRNTRSQSKKNIAAHYDLGNEFFQTFLDSTMMYSSAIFDRAEMTLEEASIHKLDRICKKLKLNETDHLLEIGTGWGGLAIHAAKHFGCRVTTTTISESQYAFAERRIAAEGLQDRITLLLKDYRELTGTYDKLVSIEMIEAVGHHFLDTYLQKCSSLLKPDGLMLIQSITIRDQRYEYARDNPDFIKTFIFPGGFLPSISVVSESFRKVTDMQLVHLEQFGDSYAETLNHWKINFHRNLKKIDQLGYPPEFQRMWEYYLSYCEGGFLEHYINCAQFVFEKPRYRQQAVLGVF